LGKLLGYFPGVTFLAELRASRSSPPRTHGSRTTKAQPLSMRFWMNRIGRCSQI